MYFILLVGFFDDLVELSARKKLLGEIIAGFIIIVIANVRITHLHGLLGIDELPIVVSYLLSFFVYLLIVNSLNLIDGVDGLASGLGIIYSAFFALYFQLIGENLLSIIAYCMVGTLLIFFIYNVFGEKSKIFMGDSGSLVIGYTLYLLVTHFCEINATEALRIGVFGFKSAPIVAICVLALPLFDTLRVVITRIKKGTSPFAADKNHMHHLLLSTGLKHKEVTFILIFINITFIILGFIVANWKMELALIPIIIYAYILIYTMWRVGDKHNSKLKKEE
jgi:UDP-N-acetylmuramyl pentapeptide phosphotransferase/UDP-N-acetylglucosamine-1-phosphate transferase